MKKLQNLSCIVFTIVLLASCEKKEIEENKPAEQIPEEIIEPNPDQIRKVIRYNNTGGIDDSILFKYDSQNRVARIEFGAFINGRFKNKIDYAYSSNAATGTYTIMERDSALVTAGQYYPISWANFSVNSDYRKAGSVIIPSSLRYSIAYDSSGFVNSVRQSGQKQSDPFQDVTFQSQNNNLTEFVSDSDLAGHYRTSYEYYQSPYVHNLYFNLNELGMRLFWNGQLSDIFSFRHSFLGRRNANLVKKQTTYLSQNHITETNYEYEFNDSGLVSKVNTSTTTATGVTSPMATKYEIFYY